MPDVLLLDIDGVVCEPQQSATDEMHQAIFKTGMSVYFVTGNTYTRAVDLAGGGKIFCNNADELRSMGNLLWQDDITPPLPQGLDYWLLPSREEDWLPGNCFIEWRSPRFVNYSRIGRFASKNERDSHDVSWRESFINYTKNPLMECVFGSCEAVIGGQVSVDIYSKGADKSRAGKWLNDNGYTFTFIGDKTSPGGNDYPLVEYCQKHPENKVITSTGPQHTIEILNSLHVFDYERERINKQKWIEFYIEAGINGLDSGIDCPEDIERFIQSLDKEAVFRFTKSVNKDEWRRLFRK